MPRSIALRAASKYIFRKILSDPRFVSDFWKQPSPEKKAFHKLLRRSLIKHGITSFHRFYILTLLSLSVSDLPLNLVLSLRLSTFFVCYNKLFTFRTARDWVAFFIFPYPPVCRSIRFHFSLSLLFHYIFFVLFFIFFICFFKTPVCTFSEY